MCCTPRVRKHIRMRMGVGVRMGRPSCVGPSTGLAVYNLARRMREWRSILSPSAICTAMRVRRSVIVGLVLEIFAARQAREVGCSNGRCGGALGKSAKRLKYLSMPRSMFNAPDHFAAFGFVLCATKSLLTFESIELIGGYTRQGGERGRGVGEQRSRWTGVCRVYWTSIGLLWNDHRY